MYVFVFMTLTGGIGYLVLNHKRSQLLSNSEMAYCTQDSLSNKDYIFALFKKENEREYLDFLNGRRPSMNARFFEIDQGQKVHVVERYLEISKIVFFIEEPTLTRPRYNEGYIWNKFLTDSLID